MSLASLLALTIQNVGYLFGTSRSFIGRIEIHHHRLPFEFGEAHRLPILVFQSEGWRHLAFGNLKLKENTKEN